VNHRSVSSALIPSEASGESGLDATEHNQDRSSDAHAEDSEMQLMNPHATTALTGRNQYTTTVPTNSECRAG
jgi:hypothetical protein